MASFSQGALLEQLTITSTAGGTTTLTSASRQIQKFTGTSNQTVALPDATTLKLSRSFNIINKSTGYITVQNNTTTFKRVLAPDEEFLFKALDISSAAGVWDVVNQNPDVTQPLRIFANPNGADSKLYIAPNNIQSSDGGEIVSPPLSSTISTVTASTIDFQTQATTGATFVVTWPTGTTVSNYYRVGLSLLANGNIQVLFSAGAGSLGAVANPGTLLPSGTIPIGWIDLQATSTGGLFKTAGSSTSVIESQVAGTATIHRFGSGGSGGGGGTSGLNYITNPSADSTTTDWSTYADAAGAQPVDGTGGTANVTWTRSTTTPLRGSADFNFAKDAANRQGQGVSTDFTIDLADQAKVLSVTFDYEVVSGTYADGDLTIYLIADPAGTPIVLQPAGYTIMSATAGTKMKALATFQTEASGQTYRLCFHVASTSASAYTLAIDNVVVGPQPFAVTPAMGDWKSFTPTGSWTTNTTYTGAWRRVGDSVELQYVVSTSGTPASGNLTVNLPAGMSIDASKLTHDTISVTGESYDGSSGIIVGPLVIRKNTATSLSVGAFQTGSGTNPVNIFSNQNAVTPTAPGSFGANGFVRLYGIKVPVSGWSSNVVSSADTDSRVVAARVYSLSTNLSLTGTPAQVVFNTVDKDSHGSYSSGTYTVPVSGYYDISAQLYFAGASMPAGGILNLELYNATTAGVIASTFYQQQSGGSFASYNVNVPFSVKSVYLNAGNQIYIRAYTSNGSFTTPEVSNAAATFFSISRISGPAVVQATETVAARYNTSSTSMGNASPTAIVFTNKLLDTHNAYNTSTGVFTCPVSGTYQISGSLCFAVNSTGLRMVRIYKNGTYQCGGTLTAAFASDVTSGVAMSIEKCNSGDTLAIYGLQTSGVSMSVGGLAEDSSISIVRVGN